MATHSRVLAWEILWTEEPDGLQFMGSKELGTIERLNNDNSIYPSPPPRAQPLGPHFQQGCEDEPSPVPTPVHGCVCWTTGPVMGAR